MTVAEVRSEAESGTAPGSCAAGLLLVSPNVVFLALVLLAPLAIVLAYSFFTYSPSGVALSVATLANYRKLGDPYYLALLGRTAYIASKTTLICAAVGYPVAYFLARATRSGALLGMFLLMAPLMVSAVVRAFGWLVLLGRNGIINSLLAEAGLERVELLYSETAVLVSLVQMLLPFMVLPLVASIERIPPALEDAARNLGANSLRIFSKVILPLSVPGLISGAFLVYVESASAFVMPALLGGRRVRMVGNEVYDEMLTAFNSPGASMLTVSLVIFTLAVLLATSSLARRLGRRA
jgi:ABC-type spermidine/putrescine transport system permease subunit I